MLVFVKAHARVALLNRLQQLRPETRSSHTSSMRCVILFAGESSCFGPRAVRDGARCSSHHRQPLCAACLASNARCTTHAFPCCYDYAAVAACAYTWCVVFRAHVVRASGCAAHPAHNHVRDPRTWRFMQYASRKNAYCTNCRQHLTSFLLLKEHIIRMKYASLLRGRGEQSNCLMTISTPLCDVLLAGAPGRRRVQPSCRCASGCGAP